MNIPENKVDPGTLEKLPAKLSEFIKHLLMADGVVKNAGIAMGVTNPTAYSYMYKLEQAGWIEREGGNVKFKAIPDYIREEAEGGVEITSDHPIVSLQDLLNEYTKVYEMAVEPSDKKGILDSIQRLRKDFGSELADITDELSVMNEERLRELACEVIGKLSPRKGAEDILKKVLL